MTITNVAEATIPNVDPHATISMWKSITVAIIIPINADQPEPPKNIWKPDDWTLSGIPSGFPGAAGGSQPTLDWFGGALYRAVEPLSSGNIKMCGNSSPLQKSFEAILNTRPSEVEDSSSAWVPVLTRLADQGLRLLSVEKRSYSERIGTAEQVSAFAVVHLELLGESLKHPEKIAQAIRMPQTGPFAKEVTDCLQEILLKAGLVVSIRAGGYVKIDGARGGGGNLYPIFHAIAGGNVPDCTTFTQTHTSWLAAEQWAYALSTGSTSKQRVPSDRANEARLGTTQSEHLWLSRMDEQGACFIGWDADAAPTLGVNPQQIHTRIRKRVHSHYLSLLLLSLRQRSALNAHDVDLSDAVEKLHDTDVQKALQYVVELEKSLLDIRNSLWATEVREHEDGTNLLRTFQQRVGSARLLEVLESRQNDIARIVALEVQIEESKARGRKTAEREEDEKRRVTEDGRIVMQRQAAEEARHVRDEELRKLTVAATWLIVPSLILAGAALLSDPNPWLLGGGVVVALMLTGLVLATHSHWDSVKCGSRNVVAVPLRIREWLRKIIVRRR